jgi:hypothetical protein
MRSICRKKTGKKCLRVKGCKQTIKTMKRKSYCRKSKKHIVTGGDIEEYFEENKNKTFYDDKIVNYLITLKKTHCKGKLKLDEKFPTPQQCTIKDPGLKTDLKLKTADGEYVLTIKEIYLPLSKDENMQESVEVFICSYFNPSINTNVPVDIKIVHNRYANPRSVYSKPYPDLVELNDLGNRRPSYYQVGKYSGEFKPPYNTLFEVYDNMSLIMPNKIITSLTSAFRL